MIKCNHIIVPIAVVRRFWRFVNRAGPCWAWTGGRDKDGYGLLSWPIGDGRTRTVRVHRLSWALRNGSIPPGVHILHSCDNPPCCNPDHLFPGTAAINNADKATKGRSLSGDRNPARRHQEHIRAGIQRNREAWIAAKARGEHVRTARLTTKQVIDIRRRYVKGVTRQVDLAAEFGVTQQQIGAIINRRSWAHVP